MTLKQVARRTGLSVSLLSQIERAESSASIGALYRIAVALDVKVGELFGEF
ncbi:MAG: helix-turn-helix transcriptional regulator [Proteobacteria bacterium]|nr:helix-turn-helix transcriptional regulator [Pseudomonadota bacterium]